MRPVLTKQDFVRRYQRGEFGNCSPTWDTIIDWRLSNPNPKCKYHLRNRIVGGNTYYNLTLKQLETQLSRLIDKDGWYISEMAPTEKTVIQGEVQQSDKGLYFRYTTERLPMREALAVSTRHATGIETICLLRRYLCPTSYDWLDHLLREYPAHVIEFSTYSEPWGTIPNMNTVFWEVRKY